MNSEDRPIIDTNAVSANEAYPRPDPEAQITKVIENTIADLESLRYGIESAGSKYGLLDVRDHRGAGAFGATHLRGIETVVRYDDLVSLINSMTLGLSRRRVALATS